MHNVACQLMLVTWHGEVAYLLSEVQVRQTWAVAMCCVSGKRAMCGAFGAVGFWPFQLVSMFNAFMSDVVFMESACDLFT